MRTQSPRVMLVPEEPEPLDGGERGGVRLVGINAGGGVQASTVNINQTTTVFGKAPVRSICTVRAPIDDFQGRTDLLRTIHEKLQIGPGSDVGKKLALVGSRGMGKSELARKFVATYKHCYPNAAWIQAETDESCRDSFLSLANDLGLKPGSGESGSHIAKRVFRHTGKYIPSTLFIYDNAQKLRTTECAAVVGIQDYLPCEIYSHPPMILITSQSTTEWHRGNIDILTVPQLTQTESIEYFRCRFKLSDKELRSVDQGLLMAQIQELAECLQGFPPGLQLAAGNVDYVPQQDSLSQLRRSLDSFVKLIQETANRELMAGSARNATTTATPHSQTLKVVWYITMKKLETEECAPAALHLLRILSYCNPERTPVKDLVVVFKGSAALNEIITAGADNFGVAIKLLQKLALIHVYEDGWLVNRIFCVRIQNILQKLLREDDKDGVGLQNILASEKTFLASNYMSIEPVLTVPPSIMANDDLMMAFLKCFSHGLRLDRTLKNTTTTTGGTVGRFQFGPREQQQLRERGGANVEHILAAVELLQTFEKEKDVGLLYLTAARYAKTHEGYFGKLAEIWALTCWASKPTSCSPFRFKRLTGTILVVSIVVLLITATMDEAIKLQAWEDLIVAQVMHLVFLILVNTASHFVVPQILLCFYPLELKPVLALQHSRLFHAFNMLCTLLWLFGFFMLIIMSCLRSLGADDDNDESEVV